MGRSSETFNEKAQKLQDNKGKLHELPLLTTTSFSLTLFIDIYFVVAERDYHFEGAQVEGVHDELVTVEACRDEAVHL